MPSAFTSQSKASPTFKVPLVPKFPYVIVSPLSILFLYIPAYNANNGFCIVIPKEKKPMNYNLYK